MRPEMKEVSELGIGDADGYLWRGIPKMVEGLGFKNEEIREMHSVMRRYLAVEEGKYQVF